MSHYSITPQNEETSNAVSETDPVKLQRLLEDIKSKQSLPMAILGGIIASTVAAILWALITYATGYQIGFMAIGVGLLVGFAVKYLGQGMTANFGVVGAIFSLFGCLFGNLLTAVLAASLTEGIPFSAILTTILTSPEVVLEIMKATFSPMDLLFYGIAVYEGYKISIRQFSEEELESLQRKPVTTQSL